MPTYKFQMTTKKRSKTMNEVIFENDQGQQFRVKDEVVRNYMIGPRGEKRPISDDETTGAVRVGEIATGLREEEYLTADDMEEITDENE